MTSGRPPRSTVAEAACIASTGLIVGVLLVLIVFGPGHPWIVFKSLITLAAAGVVLAISSRHLRNRGGGR